MTDHPGTASSGGNVVPLGAESIPPPEAPPSGPSSRLHGAAITGMALSALLGIASMLAFATVHWTGAAAHYVIAVVIIAAAMFLAAASTAVFTAARDTYANGGAKRGPSPDDEPTDRVT